MTLLEKQFQFMRMLPDLINLAHELGYELTLGHGWRCPECPTGRDNSLHKSRLAVDLNIFRDGVYLTDGTGHFQLHAHWSEIGGSPPIGNDLNHYSVSHNRMT